MKLFSFVFGFLVAACFKYDIPFYKSKCFPLQDIIFYMKVQKKWAEIHKEVVYKKCQATLFSPASLLIQLVSNTFFGWLWKAVKVAMRMKCLAQTWETMKGVSFFYGNS